MGSYEKADFRWGVAAVPYHDGRKVTLFVDPWSISNSSKHPDEAWEFVRYLADPKTDGGAYRYMNDVGRTPADSTCLNCGTKKCPRRLGWIKRNSNKSMRVLLSMDVKLKII